MKLLDILNERRSVPLENKISIQVLKEFIFKDWQTYNQRLVPSFRLLRNRIIKETYSQRTAKNNILSLVEFAAKKYIAEKTDRKYLWNEMFTKNDRYELANILVEFFEKYNLSENSTLLVEQETSQIEAKITFSEIELETVDNNPRLVINFNYDEETTNHITNVLGRNQSAKLSEKDTLEIDSILKVQLESPEESSKMSYLKFYVSGNQLSKTDLKQLTAGVFLNRSVTLEVVGEQEPQNTGDEFDGEQSQEQPAEEPQTQGPEVNQAQEQPRQRTKTPNISDRELQEIVKKTIKNYLVD